MADREISVEFLIYKEFFEKCQNRPKRVSGHVLTRYFFDAIRDAEIKLKDLNAVNLNSNAVLANS